MLAGVELLSLLFYISGGVVEGATRLQKIVFLVQSRLGIGGFRFEASKYGPWLRELEETLKMLARRGELVVEERVAGELQDRPAKVYTASRSFVEKGEEIFRSLFRTNPALALKLRTMVRVYITLPITYLLAYVYREYPEYRIRSIELPGGLYFR
ncbi:MAG: hypothetical protein QXI64_10920 [Sulfolobales archaeon]